MNDQIPNLTEPVKNDNLRFLIAEGEVISREVALQHYENFAIIGRFFPVKLKQDFYNIYAFCRLADDFADEHPSQTGATESLITWENLLLEAVRGVASDPLFCALGDTMQRRGLSPQPFLDLLTAFKLDLTKKRYQNWSELREYTRYSADPVGRIVLQFFGHGTSEYFAYSDYICTALQLANHWQDLASDFDRGRIYVPLEDLEEFSVTEEMIAKKEPTENFRELMRFEVSRARKLFHQGRPLLKMVHWRLRVQLEIYWSSGMAALKAIEQVNYDVFDNIPHVSGQTKILIAGKALLRSFG